TQNVVLIGGNNGSGKTTLLNAIKIAIFGSHAFGFTTNSNTYMKKIHALMHKKAVQNKNERFFLKIKYDAIEHYVKNEYIIVREWIHSNSAINDMGIQENVEVYQNGKKLADLEKENYFNELKQMIQPALIDSIMFDGENVAKIIEEGRLPGYIRTVFHNCFNFNLFDTFQKDIDKYLTKLKNQSNLSDDEMKALELRQEINSLVKMIDLNEMALKDKNSKQKNSYEERKSLLERFKNLGGLSKKDLKEVEKRLSNLEKERKEMMVDVRNFLESYYPLVLNKKLFKKSFKTIKNDYPFVLAQRVVKMSENNNLPDDAKSLLDSFINHYNVTDERILFQDITEDQINHLELQWTTIKNVNMSDYKDKFTKSQNDLKLEGSLKNEHAKNIESKILTDITDKINAIQNEISEVEEEIENYKNTILEMKENLKSKRVQLENIEKEIFTSRKKSNSFIMAQKIMKLNQTFVDQQISKQVKAMERLALNNFNQATNKDLYITMIKINPATFEVSLYDQNNDKHSEKILSAGEKQIMVASIVKAIFDLAKRRLMFVYDTPLARLDQENRTSFSKEIMSKASQQVIILSTDAEVVGDVYNKLKSDINKTYLLEATNQGYTKIHKSYFKDVTV
ncbi:MAG: DNA sulfur modification protein DndD, partial [bacterium]